MGPNTSLMSQTEMKRQKDISSYFSKQAATVSSRPKLGQAGHSTAVSELSATVLCPAPAAVLHPAIATANASTDFDDPPTVAMAPTAVGPLADAVVTTAPSAVARPAATAASGDIFDVSDIGYAVQRRRDGISVPEEHARQYLDKATWRPPAHFDWPKEHRTTKGKVINYKLNPTAFQRFSWAVYSTSEAGLFCKVYALFNPSVGPGEVTTLSSATIACSVKMEGSSQIITTNRPTRKICCELLPSLKAWSILL